MYVKFAENGTSMTDPAFNVNTGGEYIQSKDGSSNLGNGKPAWNDLTSN